MSSTPPPEGFIGSVVDDILFVDELPEEGWITYKGREYFWDGEEWLRMWSRVDSMGERAWYTGNSIDLPIAFQTRVSFVPPPPIERKPKRAWGTGDMGTQPVALSSS
ncbi:MAG: hypothetical protein QGH59_04835, partial [Gemmatimonadota bacterium]|nr:hypothetical protein [Gemmatimonadota bacterium]